MNILTKFFLLLCISSIFLVHSMDNNSHVSKGAAKNSAVINMLLKAGAEVSKQKEHVIEMPLDSNTGDSQVVPFHYDPELTVNNTKRASACSKLNKFFNSIVHGFYSLLRKPLVLNTLSLTPVAIEAVGGYYGYQIGETTNEKISGTIIGILGPLFTLDLLNSFMQMMIACPKEILCGGKCDVPAPTTALGHFLISVPLFGLAHFCNNNFPIVLVIITPNNIIVYGPYKECKTFLERKIKAYFDKYKSNQQIATSLELSHELQELNIFPAEINDIIQQYAQSDEENIIANVTKINNYNAPHDALKILKTIYSYAREVESNDQSIETNCEICKRFKAILRN